MPSITACFSQAPRPSSSPPTSVAHQGRPRWNAGRGLFILPGFVSILVLSVLYAQWGHVAWVQGIFRGIGPAVIAIVAHAVLRIGRRTIKNPTMLAIAIGAFVAIFFYQLLFPLLVLLAGVIGLVGAQMRPDTFVTLPRQDVTSHSEAPHVSVARTVRVLVIGVSLWLIPVLLIATSSGPDSVWTDIGTFFSQPPLSPLRRILGTRLYGSASRRCLRMARTRRDG